jgi:arsenate reductase
VLRSRRCRLRHPLNVLVLCTGNSARSILGEVLFNRLGGRRVKAYSAGSKPAGTINPGALRLLSQHGVAAKGLRSKSWSEFAQPDAPKMDIVITVCGSAAGEACPAFPGKAIRAHWGLADPAGVEGVAAQDAAFARTWELLSDRVRAMLALPLETMPNEELEECLSLIGQMEGAA